MVDRGWFLWKFGGLSFQVQWWNGATVNPKLPETFR